MFQLIDITIDLKLFSINWKNYCDQSILVISMTVLYIYIINGTYSIKLKLSEVSYLFLFHYSVTYSFSLPYSQLLLYSKTGLKGLLFLMMTHRNSLVSQ